MPFQNPILPSDPSRRALQRGLDNVTLSYRAGPGIIAAKTGNHYQISAQQKRGGGGASPTIPVRINEQVVLRSVNITVGGGSSVSVEVAWMYGGTECAPNTTTGLSVDASSPKLFSAAGSIGSTTPPIFNLAELNHTTAYVWGIDVSSSNYPTGNRPRPVGGGGTSNTHKYDRVVYVRSMLNSAGNLVYVMDEWGSHDGSCL